MDDMGDMDDQSMNDASLLDSMDELGEDTVFGADGDGAGGQKQTLQFQTIRALQELGLVIAVALMVGIIFMSMISVEKLWNSISDYYYKRFGDVQEDDEEDPAALVGTFKRYKN